MLSILLLTAVLSSPAYSHPKIIGGHRIPIEKAPYQVAILVTRTSTFCGGSVIADNFILTAGHCVYDEYSNSIFLAREIVVFAGVDTASSFTAKSVLKVQKVFLHPQFEFKGGYNFAKLNNDFAVLKLAKGQKFPAVVRPIKLSEKHEEVDVGETMIVTGWGVTEDNFGSEHLKAVEVQMIDHERCKENYEKIGYKIGDETICAGSELGGRDACQGWYQALNCESKYLNYQFLGDSGGPLVRKADGVQYGVVSHGHMCGLKGFPGAYSKVSSAVDWIKNIVKYS